MKSLPSTIEGCWREIRELRIKQEKTQKQLIADSEAIHQLVGRVTDVDKEMFEKCKKCKWKRL